MFDLVLENVRLVLEDATRDCVIGVKDGDVARIAEPGTHLEGEQVLDCAGKLVLPGFIDLHVHFNEPGLTRREDYFTGSSSAAAGGVTLFADMPLSNEPYTLSETDVRDKFARAAKNSVVDYAVWAGLVENNTGQMAPMAEAGAYGFKMFTCDAGDGFPMPAPETMRQGFIEARKLGTFVGVHCEDQTVMDRIAAEKHGEEDEISRFLAVHCPEAEIEATKHVISLSEETGGHLHVCHASLPEVVDLVSEAKGRCVPVTVETCPQYLLSTTDDLRRIGGRLKCTPPVRSADDVEGMWQRIEAGYIDFIGTDHSPAETFEKERESFDQCWGGINGVQFLFPLLHTEGVVRRGLSPELLVRLYSAAPARFIGQYPRKGTLAEGSEATFVIFDPKAQWTIRAEDLLTKHRQTPYAGMPCVGRVEQTWLRGEPVCLFDSETGKHRLTGLAGSGKPVFPVNNKGK